MSSHEINHGYTGQNSNLNYDGQSAGGINEAFSGMAGEAAEYFNDGSNDFKVGAQAPASCRGLLRFNGNQRCCG